MIALDTMVLVYAHRRDSPFHDAAAAAVRSLAEGPAPWSIPWPCAHEFIAVCTHPRIYDPPSRLEETFDQLDAWAASPSHHFIGETSDHLLRLARIAVAGDAQGPRIHDARVAAVCLEHGADELWTVDRDFSRFPELRTANPLG